MAAAIETVRERVGQQLPAGACLSVVACHFLRTWQELAAGSLSRSEKVRERDSGVCQVPGCSHRAAHAHHVALRSHGGGDELTNQTALCAFHHLRCVHGGWMSVTGRAPDALTWTLRGVRFTGRPHGAG